MNQSSRDDREFFVLFHLFLFRQQVLSNPNQRFLGGVSARAVPPLPLKMAKTLQGEDCILLPFGAVFIDVCFLSAEVEGSLSQILFGFMCYNTTNPKRTNV